jgi:exonuclease SbcD
MIKDAISKAKELGLDRIYVGGDIFTSRKSQFLAVLLSWMDVLDFAEEEQIDVVAIPGNHDKADYTCVESYLDVYEDHSAFTLVRTHAKFQVGKFTLHLVPFFEEKQTYGQYLKLAKPEGKHDILLTHVAVNGVRNNDGSEVEESLSASKFDKFFKVFIGHYHDAQQVGDNIYYIGSLRQKNYGEDEYKGYTVLYEDGSHEMIPSEFKKFVTVKIDLDEVDNKELTNLRKQYQDSEDSVRFKFTGSKEKVTSLDKSKFDAVGIDVKCEYKNVDVDVDFAQAEQFGGFDQSKIKEEWIEFCQNNDDIDQEQGTELLNQIL